MNGHIVRTVATRADDLLDGDARAGTSPFDPAQHHKSLAADRELASVVTTPASKPTAIGGGGGSASKTDHSRRKLAMLKRCGLFGHDLRGATIVRACKWEDLREAYRLAHDVYSEAGYIRPDPSGLRVRMFEAMPETATFIAKVNQRIVGVLSVVVDSPLLGLPSDEAFKAELDAVRGNNKKLCEMTNQAVAADYRNSAVPTELMRCAMAHGFKAGYSGAIATVSASHQGFYRMLGFMEVGSERSYSATLHDPVVALTVEADHYRQPLNGLDQAEQFVQEFMTTGNPFMDVVTDWDAKARRRFLEASLLRQLFVTETGFITNCSKIELRALERAWGERLFAKVTGGSFLTAAQKWVEALLSVLKVHDDHPWLPIPVHSHR